MTLKRLHFYLYTFCRYFIATVILFYAFAKIFKTQFTIQPSTYDKPVTSLSGFELTWYYYGYAYWYGLALATMQIISSLLIFFRRTVRIGVVLFMTIMANIVMVDFAYHIDGGTGMALTLMGMALFLFFSDFPAFYDFFVQRPPLELERPKWTGKLRLVKYFYIPIVMVGIGVLLISLKQKYLAEDQLYGTWSSVNSNRSEQRIYFEAAHTFKIVGADRSLLAKGRYIATHDSLQLKIFRPEDQERMSIRPNAILGKDTLQMIMYFNGKYQLKNNAFILVTDTGAKIFNRVQRQ